MPDAILDGTGSGFPLRITIDNSALVTGFAGKNSDFLIEVAKGNIPGYAPIFITGENEAVSTTKEAIRPAGDRYVFPTSAVILSISSDDADDTSAGTGAQSVIVLGLDSSGDRISETITMDGTSTVNSVLTFLRIEAFQVATTGSSNENEGTITITDPSANNLGQILPEEGSMRQQIFTVPNNKTWMATSFLPTSGKDDEIAVYANAFIGGNAFTFSKTFIYQNNFPFNNTNPSPIPEGIDFEILAQKTGAAGNSKVSLVVEFLEVDNDEF